MGNAIRYTLDNMGNVLRQEAFGAAGNLAWQTIRSFDQLGRLEREQRGADDNGVAYQYDSGGNLTAVQDQLGKTSQYEYDGLDRLVKAVLAPAAEGRPAALIRFDYNQQDQLAKITDPRELETRYAVNGFGQRTGVASPLGPPDDDVSAKDYQNWIEKHWWGSKMLKVISRDCCPASSRPNMVLYLVYVRGWYAPAYQIVVAQN